MRYISCIALCILFLIPAVVSAEAKKNRENWTIVPTQNLTVKSKILNRNIRLQVGVPEKYSTEGEKYGVIYYLDAFGYGGTLRETAKWLAVGHEIPELITVGIEMEVNTTEEWFKERSYILTPTRSDIYENFGIVESWTGGGSEFLRCIKDEIIPFIDTKYNTKTNEKTLVGHSFGGLFALYTLFSEPQLFTSYLISSPCLPWDDRVIFKMESEYAQNNKELPSNIFLSVGSLENLPDDMMVHQLRELAAVLELRKYKGLNITSVVFEGESHYAVTPYAFSKGLRVLFPPKSE